MHPSQRFLAPGYIVTGHPLKHLLDDKLVALIAESFAAVAPHFDSTAFCKEANTDLQTLAFKDRARQIARALNQQLSQDSGQACTTMIQALGPKLQVTENYGLAPLFYLPHSEWITTYAQQNFEHGMQLNYELTQRYTAEFSIRPFLVEHETAALQRLTAWCEDPNPHVRRLVSEGSRPRLPWAPRLRNIQAHPQHTLQLLERLKDDPVRYVRRSVANHLGDIAKEQLELVLDICARWLKESQNMSDASQAENRRWLLRHALRYPAKQGNPDALELRRAAQ